MIDFFLIMFYVSTILAIITSLVFSFGVLFNMKIACNNESFKMCNKQIKLCMVTSVIFTIMYWFIVSGLPEKKCLDCYDTISDACFGMGCVWIVFAFINIIIDFMLGIRKRSVSEKNIIKNMKINEFIIGAILLVISFVLGGVQI